VRTLLPSQEPISPSARERGLVHLMWDAGFATAVGALNSGVVLVAYALALGASNATIGLLAAIPFFTQLLQIPTVSLIERVRARRLIAVAALLTARLALLVMAAAPFLFTRETALAVIVVAETWSCAFNAIAACAWNSWIRDLVEEERLGRFFARRSIWAAGIGLLGSIAAGFAIDAGQRESGAGNDMFVLLYTAGFVAGMLSTWHLARVPEPMLAPGTPARLRDLIRRPLQDRAFLRLLRFLAAWHFAVNLAAPFFTVYLVQQLGFPMRFVVLLQVVSSLANLAVLRGWGALSDRFSNKTVLQVAAPLFILCIVAFVFAAVPEPHRFTAPYLIVLHALMGMASAGVGLGAGNIALKSAPRGQGTSYIATSSLVISTAAGIAPLLGGLGADFFASRELSVVVRYVQPGETLEFIGLRLRHWDFFFLIAAALGSYALHRLSFVTEQGAVEQRVLIDHMLLSARRTVRNLSSVAGLRVATSFTWGVLTPQRRSERGAPP
jgi:MFS family permease